MRVDIVCRDVGFNMHPFWGSIVKNVGIKGFSMQYCEAGKDIYNSCIQ
jgi:hypothetical protein